MAKVLNLATKDQSDIDYDKIKFPDGQQQVKILTSSVDLDGHKVMIKTRINSFLDIELLICAVASLRALYVQEIELYVPYFLGSRSDRKFETGSNNYLKTVVCPIINAIGFSSVTVLDPHSDVLEACLNSYEPVPNYQLVEWATNKLIQHRLILMSPDAGAMKKIYKVAEFLKYEGDIITCSKSRGTDGKITKTEVPHFNITKDVVLIDDICDGGRTFIEIAKIIKARHEQYERQRDDQQDDRGKLYLVVTHGIFSKGFDELFHYFDKIFCTNSYSDIKIKEGTNGENFVEQLKTI